MALVSTNSGRQVCFTACSHVSETLINLVVGQTRKAASDHCFLPLCLQSITYHYTGYVIRFSFSLGHR